MTLNIKNAVRPEWSERQPSEIERVRTDVATLFLHCSRIDGIGPVTLFEILSRVFKSPGSTIHDWPELIALMRSVDSNQLYRMKTPEFVSVGVSLTVATKLVSGLADKKLLDTVVQETKDDIRVLTIIDDEYPNLLRFIHQPPLVLYCRGDITLLQSKCIAIVGSRKATNYAHQVINNFVPELVNAGWCIVSGGALGADTMAHQATHKNNGKTIVVLGSGLEQPYPPSNEKLFQTLVASGHLLISPFSPNTPPDRGTFPARNRIISGLSQGCIIVQAARKSGALITARHALEQGRQVFAVPGSIYDEVSLGCHDLLRDGALVVNTAQDVLQEFGPVNRLESQLSLVSPPNALNPASDQLPPLIRLRQKAQFILSNVEGTGQVLSDPAHPEPVEGSNHSVLKHLTTPQSFDELLDLTNLEAHELQDQLFSLQLEGNVKQHFSGIWEKA